MAKIINASLAGFTVSSLDFQFVLGTEPGVGSATIPGGGYTFPAYGTLIVTDNENTHTLTNIYIVAVRQVQNATGGTDTICSIADRRFLWKYGYINGIYNEEDYKGVPKREQTLSQLLTIIFTALGETNYQLIDVPSVYPEVLWEFDNPGQVLNELCDKYQLCIGYDVSNYGKIIVCPINYYRTVTLSDKISYEIADTNFLLPAEIILVGDRKIKQITFENLIPVGEETDGTVKPINELSYKPTGAGGGGESYPYQKWGDEIRSCFSNLASQAVKDLAEKSVFKWYQIDFTKYPVENVLPLLNEISDIETTEGITDHQKPYVIGEKTEWNGVEFITNPKAKLTDGYQIDKKIGLVEFNEPQVKSINSQNITSGGFTLATFDLVAAFESTTGLATDFITFTEAISGGVLAPAVHKETSIIGWYKSTSIYGTLFANLVFELTNETDTQEYADEVMAQLVNQYIEIVPQVGVYPGLYLVGAYGFLRQVIFKLSATDGAETEYQFGIEIPKLHIDGYEEKFNKRLMASTVKQAARGKKQAARKVSKAASKQQSRASMVQTNKDAFGIYKKYGKDVRIGINSTGVDIPVNSIIHVASYNSTSNAFEVVKNSSSITNKLLALAPEGIVNGKKGVIILDGAGAVKKETATTIAVGDKVTADVDKFTVIPSSSGEYICTKISSNNVFVEKVSSSGGGSSLIYGKVVRTILVADPAGTPPEGYEQYEVTLLGTGITEYAAQVWQAGTIKWKVSQDLIYVSNVVTSATWVAGEWDLQTNINPRPLCQEAIEGNLITTPPDMRFFVPWFKVNEIVPLVTKSYTVGGSTQVLYFFAQQMTRIRTEDSTNSIMWNPTQNRMMAVFRD